MSMFVPQETQGMKFKMASPWIVNHFRAGEAIVNEMNLPPPNKMPPIKCITHPSWNYACALMAPGRGR